MKKVKALFYLQLALFTVLSVVSYFHAPPPVRAQNNGYVNVIGTIPAYAGGQITGSFVNQSSLPQLPLLNGSTFATTSILNLSSNGQFSGFLADNTLVQPNPSQWHFVLCWKTGNPSQPCFPITITITCVNNGACTNGTLDITSAFAGAPTPGGPTAGLPVLTIDPWVDPRVPRFGASCANNPAIDDSTPISNALAYAQTVGLEVQISGTCYIQHPIVWPNTAVSPDRGFGMRGAATGGTIKAASNFPNAGPESALILRLYGFGPTQQVTLRDITLDASATASSCATFESQRLLFLEKVNCLSATGNGGGELNFGLAAGGSALVGLTARDIEIDNGAIVAALGAASRPSYGLYLNNNATDGDVSNVNVNQNAIAGIYVNSGPNKFYSLHPWGFTALQAPAATWPQYGVYLDTHAFGNNFFGTQCDTTQLGCFFASRGFFNAYGTTLECNDGGTGSLCAQYLAVAASGVTRIHLYGGRLQAGSLTPSGSPVNWQGSVDTCSDLLTEWPTQQFGCGTTNNLIINPTLQSPNIFQPTISGVLNANGGAIHTLGAGNPFNLIESTDATGFPFQELRNGTNAWLTQVRSTDGGWELQDQSTTNRPIHVAMGAPSGSLLIDAAGNVSLVGPTLNIPTGATYKVGTATGFTGTLSVSCTAGTGTVTFTGGIITAKSGSC
jgi:hypothetical protein